MKHPRNQITSIIKINRNLKSGLYEVEENGVKYSMHMEHTETLRNSLKINQSVKTWYTKLSRTERKSVVIDGKLELGDTETYYDISE